MKTAVWFTSMAAGLFCGLSALGQSQPTIESMPPVIVKTIPESGAKDVAPGITEIKVTFSKEMMDGSWTWSTAWQNSSPEGNEKPHFAIDGRTCIMKVKLEPGKTYGYWLNSARFTGFKDKAGHTAVPYLLIFETKKQ